MPIWAIQTSAIATGNCRPSASTDSGEQRRRQIGMCGIVEGGAGARPREISQQRQVRGEDEQGEQAPAAVDVMIGQDRRRGGRHTLEAEQQAGSAADGSRGAGIGVCRHRLSPPPRLARA